jgi:hypothetical protein
MTGILLQVVLSVYYYYYYCGEDVRNYWMTLRTGEDTLI